MGVLALRTCLLATPAPQRAVVRFARFRPPALELITNCFTISFFKAGVGVKRVLFLRFCALSPLGFGFPFQVDALLLALLSSLGSSPRWASASR